MCLELRLVTFCASQLKRSWAQDGLLTNTEVTTETGSVRLICMESKN